jgi:hypothetical protein
MHSWLSPVSTDADFKLVCINICLDAYNKHVQLTPFRTMHTRLLGQISRHITMKSAQKSSISMANQHLLRLRNLGGF